MRNRNAILSSLMKAQRDGMLQGIFCRLGDLGTIYSQYDCAVTTSCGFLDHIVVDTINNAERCVSFLREHRVGTGKFICLNQIVSQNKQNRERPFQAPEGSRRLYDIIQISDERFKDAFYFALKDTLVCNEIEQATKIAYGQVRHRVVTLKGDLIEKSGTMSGGGKPKTGGMSSKLVEEYSEEQIRECETRVLQLQSHL
jgi:structural maintenance of chromosome 4